MATGVSKTEWNGTLNFESVDDDTGGVELSYKGKKKESEIIRTEPALVTMLWKGKGANLNKLYCGDNLPILVSLLRDVEV